MNDKSLFELFRRNEYKLNERPSPRTWDRIERRLDNHRRRPLHVIRRTLSMVASLAILVVLLFILSMYGREKNAKVTAFKPMTFETLAAQDAHNASSSPSLVTLSHQYYKKQVVLPETDQKKKIIAKPSTEIGD